MPDSAIASAFAHETVKPPQWIAFGKAFDGAQHLVRVSLPVYSPDGRRAVVYTVGTCPFRCGAGFYHELRKSDGPVLTSPLADTALVRSAGGES